VKFDRIFGVAACIVVAVGLVLAFLVIGPPGHARLIALDRQRVRDLETIASGMHGRFGETTERLPKLLPSALAERDPVTGRVYEFQKINSKRYALCARFALAAESEDIADSPPPRNWPHGAGRTCYEFNVSASEVSPRAMRIRTK
jgi:hypothetical protein